MIFRTIDEIIASGRKYNILYADPPWPYKSGSKSPDIHYDLMEAEAIYRMKISEIAAPDSVCFMWQTWPRITDGTCNTAMQRWGFEPITAAFVWVKRTVEGAPFIGMGGWTRSNTEPCMLGRRGDPQRIRADLSEIVDTAPDTIETVPGKHSKKPHHVRDRIVELMGDLPRIELFARYPAPGWDSFGNDDMLDVAPLETYTDEGGPMDRWAVQPSV